MEEENPQPAEAPNPENEVLDAIQKKVHASFDIFDHESNGTVDVREVGTIMRSLDLCPTETELNDVLAELEEEDQAGYIRAEKFVPVMTRSIMSKSYRPHSEDQILRAFRTLDPENKGYITADDFKKFITSEGEPLVEEEIEEMMSAAVDQEKGTIVYKEYVHLMTVDDSVN